MNELDMLERRRQLVGDHDLELLVDRDCPLCRREADWLQARNTRGRLKLVDISAGPHVALERGLAPRDVVGHIHGVLPDGRVVTGVEAFAHAYEAAGLGWLAKLLKSPLTRPVAEQGYAWFAKYRLRLTGRSDAEACAEGTCRV